jgi:hypothetical protein
MPTCRAASRRAHLTPRATTTQRSALDHVLCAGHRLALSALHDAPLRSLKAVQPTRTRPRPPREPRGGPRVPRCACTSVLTSTAYLGCSRLVYLAAQPQGTTRRATQRIQSLRVHYFRIRTGSSSPDFEASAIMEGIGLHRTVEPNRLVWLAVIVTGIRDWYLVTIFR